MKILPDEVVIGTCNYCGKPVTSPKKWEGLASPYKICWNCRMDVSNNYTANKVSGKIYEAP